MIYLNNAATTHPKPQTVLEAHAAALAGIPASQSRGTGGSADTFDECRKSLGALFGIGDASRIVFTSGATDSFNFLLSGLDLAGGKILATATEHNSVLRPLYNLKKLSGCEIRIIPCDGNGLVDPADIRKSMDGSVRAVLVNHCSNVTGAVQDLASIGRIVRARGSLFIVDVSQSGGCLPVNADEWGLDALVFTGHKGLYGPQGTGGFYLRKGIFLEPFRFGGTGTDGRRLIYDDVNAPYEVGTPNEPGIAALNAGIEFVRTLGLEEIMGKERDICDVLISALESMAGVKIYGASLSERAPLVSIAMKGITPSDLGYILHRSYGIITRSGFHCCPLIHDAVGSAESGTLRISPSYFTYGEDIAGLLDALEEIRVSLKAGEAYENS